MISVNVSDFKEILKYTPPEQPILVCGNHGIGKSEIINSFFNDKECHFIKIFLAQNSDAADIAGYLIHDKTHEKANRISPEWWPTDGKPVIVFLDELNRANPALHNVVMDLVLNRTLAGKKLPEGSRVLSAINVGSDYTVNELDPAMVSRFAVYELFPTVKEWIAWAQEQNLDKRIINFISKKPSLLDGAIIREEQEKHLDDDDINKSPDRRAWAKVADLIQNQDLPLQNFMYKAISGTVGSSASAQLREFLNSLERDRIDPQKLLMDFKPEMRDQLSQRNIQELIYLNREIVHYLNETFEDLDFITRERISRNLKKYIECLQFLGQGEAIAEILTAVERSEKGITKLVSMNTEILEALSNQFDRFAN